jgi:hypothetical protein
MEMGKIVSIYPFYSWKFLLNQVAAFEKFMLKLNEENHKLTKAHDCIFSLEAIETETMKMEKM